MADSRTSYAPLTILVLFAFELEWVFRFSYEIPTQKPRWTTPQENRITGDERKEDEQGVVILKTFQLFVCNISRTIKYGKDTAWEIKSLKSGRDEERHNDL
jgi:hypothetical protein